MHHFATLPLRNTGIFVLAGALTLFGCTIHSTTTNNHAPGENQNTTTGGEAKPDKPKEDKPKADKPASKPDKPKKDKPKADKPASKPDKPKEDKPKADKPKEDKPKADKPKEDKPKADKPKEDKPVVEPPAPALPDRSKIVLPVRVSIDALKKQIDELVPATDAKDWAQVTKGDKSPKVDLKYELWRDPIDIKLDGNTFKVAVPVRFAASFNAKLKAPITNDWVSVAKNESWGTKQEPQRLTAHFEVKLDVTDDWKIASDIKLVKLEHGDPPSGSVCKNIGVQVCVTKASLADDVREEINEKVEGKIKKALDKVQGRVEKSFDLKKRAEKVWRQVQAPQALPGAKDTWLVVRPSAIGLGRIREDGANARVDIAVEGKLSVESGSKPKITPVPLPTISKVEGDPGFFVMADLHISDRELDDKLDQHLRGLQLTGKKNEKVEVVKASVIASNDDKNPRLITVRVELGDKPEDALELQGELVYDPKAQSLFVKDFDFTTASKGALASKLASFDHGAIEKQIAARARWDLAGDTAALKKSIQAALATSFEGQANIGGTLEKLEVRDFAYKKGTLEAKLIVGGQLEVTVTGK